MAIPNITPLVKDFKLPSNGKTVRLRPYTVKEEEALAMVVTPEEKKREDVYKCVQDILKACVLTEEIDIMKLPIFDLEYLFLQLRGLSSGELIRAPIICKDEPDTTVDYTIDIADIKVSKNKDHKDKFTLTNGYGIKMKYPSFEFLVDDFMPRDMTNSKYIAECIEQIYNEEEVFQRPTTTDEEMEEFVGNLTPRDRNQIAKFFDTAPKLEHKFSVTNPNTGKESEYEIVGLEAFFQFRTV